MRSTFKITTTGDMRTVREDNARVHKVHCTCIKRGETSPDWASMSVETEDNANSSCACAPGKQRKCFLLLRWTRSHLLFPGLLSQLGFTASKNCSCEQSLVRTQGWRALESCTKCNSSVSSRKDQYSRVMTSRP